MLKRTLCFESDGALFVRDQQLVFNAKDGLGETPTARVPIEDIGVVILEGQHISITTYALDALAAAGATVLVCNGFHMPSSTLLPTAGHTATQRIVAAQLAAPEALREQLWKQTVVSKIRNQAACLRRNGKDGAMAVEQLSKFVSVGDADNREGTAAARYFKAWDIVRMNSREGPVDGTNAALNYGYAILRAATARALAGSGLICISGINNRNQYDAFVLADDVMEPYRPFVDDLVLGSGARFETGPDGGVSRAAKIELLKLLARDVRLDGLTRPLLVALSYTTASLAACFERKEKKIRYPEFPA